MSARTTFITSALALLLAGPAAGQTGHEGHHAAPPATAGESASTKAFEAANATMHENMAIDFTGNADVDFVRGMIPHHQGAIDMARVQLEHGKDPAIRKLAEEVIRAQEREIAEMRKWLEENAR